MRKIKVTNAREVSTQILLPKLSGMVEMMMMILEQGSIARHEANKVETDNKRGWQRHNSNCDRCQIRGRKQDRGWGRWVDVIFYYLLSPLCVVIFYSWIGGWGVACMGSNLGLELILWVQNI